ncbi:MAG: molecular chaperone DnaK [Planctomycetota bacterium]
MSKVIGIDLGTTNSVVSVYHEGRVQVIAPDGGPRLVPSMVSFAPNGQRLVGEAARSHQVTNPDRTVYSVKRFMGRRRCEVDHEEQFVPYEITGKPNDYCKIAVGGKSFTPQQVSAMILGELKRRAEAFLGEPVTKAVITVPAQFNDAQRQATRDAGQIAGLEVERIINEPTAAALAHGVEKRGDRNIVVFDFGGGTFDLSVLQIKSGRFEVLASSGNTHLGGDDFDQRIIDIVADDFLRREAIDLRKNPMTLQRLKQAASQAKAELSDRTSTEIMLPYVHLDPSRGPRHLQYTLTRERFDAVCEDLFDELRQACKSVLYQSGLNAGSVSDVVLVGGSTRIPKAQQIARDVFKIKDLDRSANPDEIVAQGAATLGGVLQGDLHNVHLMDVTAQSFGVADAHGRMQAIVPRNTPIPTTVKKVFSTPSDNQRSVPVLVLEGEKTLADDNRPIGTFQLTGIRKAPRGVPRIEVAFAIDANGILDVSATDLDSGKTQNIVVTGSYGMDDGEIEAMQREAEVFQEKDDEQQRTVELRNHAQQVYRDVNNWLEHNATVMPPKTHAKLTNIVAKLKKALDSRDTRGQRKYLKQLDEQWDSQRHAG